MKHWYLIAIASWVFVFSACTMWLMWNHIAYQVGVNKYWGAKMEALEEWKKVADQELFKMDAAYLVSLKTAEERIDEKIKDKLDDIELEVGHEIWRRVKSECLEDFAKRSPKGHP